MADKQEMNYDEIQKTIKMFNEHGLSAKDIEDMWNKQYWDGFDAAIEMVEAYIYSSELLSSDETARLMVDEIADEVEAYKKDE